MSTILQSILWPLASYLIGSIPSAVIVSRLFRLSDPREVGSGNPGATNVLRSGNKFAALFTLIGDLLKGLIPVLVALHFALPAGLIAVVAIAAFMGHLYSVFLGFKGGKGVATAIGVFVALSWKLGAVFIITWATVAAVTRYSSLAGLSAAALTGIASFAVFNQKEEFQLIGAVFCIVAFLFQRHRVNIERLKSGTEPKIGTY